MRIHLICVRRRTALMDAITERPECMGVGPAVATLAAGLVSVVVPGS